MPAYRVQKKKATKVSHLLHLSSDTYTPPSSNYKVLTNMQGAAGRRCTGVCAGVGSITAPIIIVDEDDNAHIPAVESSVELGDRDHITTTPAPIQGSTLRFRGLALGTIGQLYPNARFEIHRIGFPKETDLSTKGSDLVALNALIDKAAIYRVTMIECDVPTVPQVPLVWSKKYMAPESLDVTEYHNILNLGQPGAGKFSLFTYFDQKNTSWGLARQIPGRNYTLEDCFETLGVPDDLQQQVKGFGPMLWKVGDRMPHLYICKDIEVKCLLEKIKNIMLSNKILRK